MREQAPYNTLYEHRLDRIGCFMCPSSDMALIRMIEEDYPSLWKGWSRHLEAWQEANRLPKEWLSEGRWRYKEGQELEENNNC
jgi:phosphoadenosine phosphosulfate reductase